ncbi:MAG TPA: acyl-CoA reductase [Polyangiaceae bacterium]|nr:acyl-CoA reductase [Polyangiaceae bacterium]
MNASPDKQARVRIDRLLAAARALQDPGSFPGRDLRARLLGSTGLSEAGVELGLTEYLETHPSETELDALCRAVQPSPVSHVLLSANVFIAAHRALALALASSATVYVRPSRREPEFLTALAALDPELFHVVDTLEPKSHEQLTAYGRAATLAELRQQLPAGVQFSAAGPGHGVAFIHESAWRASPGTPGRQTSDHAPDGTPIDQLSRELVRDVVAFDQRGCLSLRWVVVECSEPSMARLERLAVGISTALSAAEARVPLGRLTGEELGERRRYLDTMSYVGEVIDNGRSSVSVLSPEAAPLLPPAGRNVLLVCTADAASYAKRYADSITSYCVSHAEQPDFERAVQKCLPFARKATAGRMQQPPFDGPVDLRPATRPSTL